MALKEENAHTIPEENPVTARKPLARVVPTVSAQEPQTSAVTKLVEGVMQIVVRVDHMDADLVSLGAATVKGFAGVESKLEENIAYLAGKIDVLAGVSGIAPGLPVMRRREDSQSAIEGLASHASSNVREQAQKIADDPESTLDPETVTRLANEAVKNALVAQKESDRVRALEAEKNERDRIVKEEGRRTERDAERAKDFRRNLTLTLIGAVIAGGCAIYAAYMTGHENGVVQQLQAAPPATVVLGPSTAPATATVPATTAPAPSSKK